MKIVSRNNATIKRLMELKTKKGRKEQQCFLIEGYHMVAMAKELGVLKEVYTLKEEKDYPSAIEVSEEVMKKISYAETPQGIIGVVSFLQKEVGKSHRILYLDGVSDPGNMGTLIRTAAAFGYEIWLSSTCVDVYNEKVIASTQGAIFLVPFAKKGWKDVEEKKSEGYEVYVTSLQQAMNMEETKNPEKLILVLGNEAHGVSREALEHASKTIRIPMKEMESLNVAVAGGIAMYHYFQK